MQSVSSRIWTRVAVSISYDDNHYTIFRFNTTNKYEHRNTPHSNYRVSNTNNNNNNNYNNRNNNYKNKIDTEN